jgi:hypothetical protein
MWSKFYIHRTIALIERLDVPPKRVLDILHDPPSLIMRSPVAVSFKELPSISSNQSAESVLLHPLPELKYAITDRVPIFFGLFHVRATVTATFTLASDGSNMYVEAVAGTKLRTTWSVKEDTVGPGAHLEGEVERGTLLTEVVEITVSNLTIQTWIHTSRWLIMNM